MGVRGGEESPHFPRAQFTPTPHAPQPRKVGGSQATGRKARLQRRRLVVTVGPASGQFLEPARPESHVHRKLGVRPHGPCYIIGVPAPNPSMASSPGQEEGMERAKSLQDSQTSFSPFLCQSVR